MRRKLFAAIILAALALSLTGCRHKSSQAEQGQTVETAPVVETAAETEGENLPQGEMRSYLTGEVVSTDVGLKRPYAIMINNIKDAIPQSGISQAEMIYECKVEGGITRLMALFQDADNVKKIGSIRSARHYYIDLANDDEAVYVHFGQSKYAKARIEEDKIKTISGLSSYGGEVFYRTTDRQAPHNVYTSGELLAKGLELTGISRDYPQGYEPRLKFNREDTVPESGTDAQRVDIPFDSKPYFEYDEKSGQYLRYQYGEKHIDIENNEQLAFKNIIVQYVKEKTISKKNHQDLKLTGSGKGYYISDGKAVSITWKKKGESGKTKYYDENDNEIRLNPGKTFFEEVPKDTEVTFNGAAPAKTEESAS